MSTLGFLDRRQVTVMDIWDDVLLCWRDLVLFLQVHSHPLADVFVDFDEGGEGGVSHRRCRVRKHPHDRRQEPREHKHLGAVAKKRESQF